MDPIPVRFLITKSGTESSMDGSVLPNQPLSELNTAYFPGEELSIKWIYFGRPIVHELPAVVNPGSVFHVYVALNYIRLIESRLISERRTETRDASNLIPHETSHTTLTDKSLIGFLHAVFVATLGFFWNRLRMHPNEFDHISLILLAAFSIVLSVSIYANYVATAE